ncbi:glycoside hydrolase family 3 protein [Ornithinimicrobium faecis]|uniref:glycoside hydrolase family 3 protein n=1 Tax=Ornithinimicrobium faecis TaxID=2934158 RepID=UPI0021199C01|nr:glycoside hydrolase family 3 N-terminal domain-containing protein [Ornithinimicrobium sp. HY1745]
MSELESAARAVLLAGFAGPAVPYWLPRDLDQGLGGVCLYGNNVAPGHDLADLSRSLRDLAPTAVLAVDEEGGDVTRLHATTGSPYAGPSVLGQLDSPSVTRAVAAGIGAELADAGIWLDLAPCADVNSDPLNPVIGTRSFGADPALVARHTVAFVEGLASSGVAASVKHFPGHGDTRTDSHHGLPTVRASREVLVERELVPFRAAVEAGAATVMTSHVVLEALDAHRPATFSPIVLNDVLRADLGFAGVIVTDALDMAGAQDGSGIPGAAVRALVAGADLLCLGPDTGAGASLVPPVVSAITRAVRDGVLAEQRLLEAADRVGRLRATWTDRTGSQNLAASSTASTATIEAARAASVQAAEAMVSAVTPMPRARVIHLETTSSPAIGSTRWGLPSQLGHQPTRLGPADLATTPTPQGPVLIVVRGVTADERVWRWVQDVMTSNPQARLAELGWPDPQLQHQDWSQRVIATLGASTASTDALARALGWSSLGWSS